MLSKEEESVHVEKALVYRITIMLSFCLRPRQSLSGCINLKSKSPIRKCSINIEQQYLSNILIIASGRQISETLEVLVMKLSHIVLRLT